MQITSSSVSVVTPGQVDGSNIRFYSSAWHKRIPTIECIVFFFWSCDDLRRRKVMLNCVVCCSRLTSTIQNTFVCKTARSVSCVSQTSAVKTKGFTSAKCRTRSHPPNSTLHVSLFRQYLRCWSAFISTLPSSASLSTLGILRKSILVQTVRLFKSSFQIFRLVLCDKAVRQCIAIPAVRATWFNFTSKVKTARYLLNASAHRN